MKDIAYMQPIDNSLHVIAQLFPAEPNPSKFDRTIELIKALTSTSIPGVIGQAIEATGKVYATIVSGRQRVQAVKYVADAYEVKCHAEVELARLKNENLKTQALTLYVEKSFQAEMDKINNDILLKTREIELEHSKIMHKINLEHERAIRNMNLFAQEHLHQIDKRYAEMIARNENYCLLYRQYLKSLQDNRVTSGDMIFELSKQSMNMLDRMANNPSISDKRIDVTMNAIKEFFEFIYTPDRYFVTFEEFIGKKGKIETWNNGNF